MPGNVDMEVQMSRHIAANRSDKSQRFVVLCMIAYVVSVLVLYVFSSATFFGALFLGLILVMVFAVPLHLIRARRRKIESENLDRLQSDQLQKHRAQSADNQLTSRGL